MFVCNNGGFAWIRNAAPTALRCRASDYVGGSIEVVDLNTGKVERMYCTVASTRFAVQMTWCSTRTRRILVHRSRQAPPHGDHGSRFRLLGARRRFRDSRKWIGPILTPNGVGRSPGRKHALRRRDRNRSRLVLGDHRPGRSTQASVALAAWRHPPRRIARSCQARQSRDRCVRQRLRREPFTAAASWRSLPTARISDTTQSRT